MSNMRKKRIMIVDDQKAATHLWRTLLEMTGSYVVQEENRSIRALQTAHDFGPDLIVLDLNMPELDGSEVAADMSTDGRLKDTPILFMTSLVSEQEAADGKRIEGYPCIAKTASIDGMIVTIEKHLSGRRSCLARVSGQLAA